MKQHYKISTRCGALFNGIRPDHVDQILNIIIGEGHYRSLEGAVYESFDTIRSHENVLAVVELEGDE